MVQNDCKSVLNSNGARETVFKKDKKILSQFSLCFLFYTVVVFYIPFLIYFGFYF